MAGQIQLSEEAQRILRDLEAPEWMMEAMAGSMKRENQFTLSKIQRDYLTGRGPFPPEEHKLGVRSSRLRGAARASDPVVSGTRVQSSIGDNVEYAAIHEFGWRIVHKPRTGTVRLRTDAQGNLLRQAAGTGALGHLAIFAKAEHKRVKVQFQSKGFETVIPERAPFRTGIGERLDAMGRGMSSDLVAEWRARK